MERPKVSILIPAYNYAHFLPEALDSILSQDFQDYEVIVSDNASTDRTTEVVQPYLEKNARIKFFRQETNLGMVGNWNWCLDKAQGEYIKYLFADDALASDKALTHLVCLLDDNPSAAMAASARYCMDCNAKIVGLVDDMEQEGLIRGGDAIKACLLRNHNLIGEPSVVIFRRNLAARGFDRGYLQLVDLEMWFHLCMEHDLVYTRQPLCCFRRHPDQQTELNSKSENTRFEGVRLFLDYFSGLNQSKSVEMGLTEYYRLLFVQIRKIKKADNLQEEQLQQLARLKQMLPARWYFFCWAHYRLFRPFQNLRRSLKKRTDRKLAMKAADSASMGHENYVSDEREISMVERRKP